MYELKPSHVEIIIRDVENHNIFFSHLKDDLIDHLCCDIENEMQHGFSFQDAYDRVRKRMGTGRLCEIQEETLFAVDNKYRFMKRTMKISVIAGTVLLSFSVLMKLLHLPFAGVTMTIGALALLLVFLPSAIVVLWKETRSKGRLMLFASGIIAGAAYIIGTLFKVQHWPGGGVILSISVAVIVLLFIPSLLVVLLRSNEARERIPIYITGVTGALIYLVGFWFKIMHWPLSSMLIAYGSALVIVIALPWFSFAVWKKQGYVSTEFIFMVVVIMLFFIPGSLVNMNLQRSYEERFEEHLERLRYTVSYLEKTNSSFIERYSDSVQYTIMEALHHETTDLLRVFTKVSTMEVSSVVDGSAIQILDNAMKNYQSYILTLCDDESAEDVADLLISSLYMTDITATTVNDSFSLTDHSFTMMRNGVLTAEALILYKLAGNCN